MATQTIQLTDTAIKKFLKARDSQNITELRDTNSRLRLRINKARTGGTWFIVFHERGGSDWVKLGRYPELPYKALEKQIPGILLKRAKGDDALNNRWASVAGLLKWYQDRIKGDRQITKKRKASVCSGIKRHLIPKLGEVSISELNRELIDERLVWPLQSEYKISYIMQLWGILKAACSRAHKLKLIVRDPLSGLKLSDFVAVKPKPKPAAIRPDYLPELVRELEGQAWPAKALVLLMLFHGTRIGETRKAKWTDFDLFDAYWHLPIDNVKTREAFRLPLTETALSMLRNYKAYQEANGLSGLYLFPSAGKQHWSESVAGKMVRQVSRGNWQAHDMRKLARTVWTDLGVDYHIGERLLNHKLSNLNEVYIHTSAEKAKREALVKYHDWLSEKGIKNIIN